MKRNLFQKAIEMFWFTVAFCSRTQYKISQHHLSQRVFLLLFRNSILSSQNTFTATHCLLKSWWWSVGSKQHLFTCTMFSNKKKTVVSWFKTVFIHLHNDASSKMQRFVIHLNRLATLSDLVKDFSIRIQWYVEVFSVTNILISCPTSKCFSHFLYPAFNKGYVPIFN